MPTSSRRSALRGLVLTPSFLVQLVPVGIDAHIVLGWWSSTTLCLPQFSRWRMSVHFDVWPRELPRTGLSAIQQQELLRRLAWAIGRRTRYFPDSPLAYVERVKEPLLSAFLPQKGPFVMANAPTEASEVISRSRLWELVYLELSFSFGARRPPHDLHIVLVDVICMLARNQFPLTTPPPAGWRSYLRW